ncbi:MAG: hypothetical protein ACPGEG_01395 [Salibacteraceae bacterium]
MKRIFLLSMAVLWQVITIAQSECDWADLQWGENIKRPPGRYWGTQEFGPDLYMSVWRDGDEVHLITTTGNMNIIKQREVEIVHQAKKGKWYFERFFRLGTNMYVMSKIKVKKEEKFYYYVQAINPESLELEEEPTLIGDMTFLRSSFKELEDITIAPDYSKFYFGHNNGTRDLSKFWYEVQIIDADLETVYEDKITIENDEALNTAYIDFYKNGDVAVLAKRSKEKEDKEKGKPNYYYTAAVMRSGEVSKYTLDLSEYFISGAGITFGQEGEIILSGYYSTISANKVNGVFFMKEDVDSETLEPAVFNEFSIEEITKFASEKSEKKNKKKEAKGKEIEFNDFDVFDLIATSEGVYLLGEQSWMYVTYTYTSNGTRTVYHYVFADVMAMKFDYDGEIQWTTRLPKWQHSTNDGGPYSSFNYDIEGNSVYILYNDHIDNHTMFDPKKVRPTPWGGDKSVTSIAKIDSEGELTKGYLYNVKEEALFTKVRESSSLDGETGFMIMAQKKKNIKFAKVTVEE